jgi:hypothetical protein
MKNWSAGCVQPNVTVFSTQTGAENIKSGCQYTDDKSLDLTVSASQLTDNGWPGSYFGTLLLLMSTSCATPSYTGFLEPKVNGQKAPMRGVFHSDQCWAGGGYDKDRSTYEWDVVSLSTKKVTRLGVKTHIHSGLLVYFHEL